MTQLHLADHRAALRRLPRRALLRGSLSVGALSLLTEPMPATVTPTLPPAA